MLFHKESEEKEKRAAVFLLKEGSQLEDTLLEISSPVHSALKDSWKNMQVLKGVTVRPPSWTSISNFFSQVKN